MKEEFERKTFEEKVSYLVENLRKLPDELAVEGVEILAKAGETEYAVVLARDKGMTDKAIAILTDAGDFLWAALIAKNAGEEDLCRKLYREGLQYYIEMEMFGRAISTATALGLSKDEIDDLYRRGVAKESQGVDLSHSRDMIDFALQSLDMSIIGRDDELSRQVMHAVHEEREKNAKQ
ncbi:MAG: hypothetical protein PHY05_05880 [Methanothrix sp.]|nr:hypothetical protein [Methanothrix sp.]